MPDPIQKIYSSASDITPAFDVTPRVGLAALDVTFIDQQFTGLDPIQKAYVADPGLDTIEKVYNG